jgi:predicted porin
LFRIEELAAKRPAQVSSARLQQILAIEFEKNTEERGMKKTLLATAVAATLGTSLGATAQSTVVIYGRLYPELVYARTSSPTAPGTPVATMQDDPTGERGNVTALEASNSRLGFRGEEGLGKGLKAIWQIEQTINVDSGGGNLASRDTFVGLESETWGTVRLGFMDTVYKDYGDTLSFLGISSGNFVSISNVLSKSNLSDTSAASFHLRRANSIKYDSPEWNDFGFALQYSPDELKNATNAYLWAVAAKYEREPFYFAIAYEYHHDFFGGSRASRSDVRNNNDPNASSRDDAVRLTAQYKFGIHTVEGNYARLRYRESGGQVGRFQKYESDHWGLTWDARWVGPWRTAVSYSGANDGKCALVGGVSCSTDGLEGYMVAIGAGYNLSRRTMLFALASYLHNGTSALFNNAASITPAVGADISQVAVGISHVF